MSLKKFKPTTPGQRHKVATDFAEITASAPEKSLLASMKKSGGRNNDGRMTMRYLGGGHKQRYRIIITDTEGYYKNNWTVKYQPPVVSAKTSSSSSSSSAASAREIELADADIIEIDEETGILSVTTESSAKSKINEFVS
jgi:hypothetical protein